MYLQPLLCRVTEYLTLPNLQVSYIPTYRYAGTTSAGNHSFIHSFNPLPPSLPPGCRLGIYVCVCTCASGVSVCLRLPPCMSAYLSVCMYIHTIPLHTHKRYISQVHIKDTCTRVSWGMWLFLILKIYLPIRSTQKNHPTNVRAPALSFTTSLGEFMCKPKQNFPFKLAP